MNIPVPKHLIMRIFFLLLFIASGTLSKSQYRVNKLSLTAQTNFYSYGEGQGSLNNVVRLGEGFGVNFKTYDTIRKKGMIYELNLTNPTAYYKNVLGPNTVLEVNDLYANLNLIMPMLILYQEKIEHTLGVGISFGTLAGRDYYDENNNVLPYNTTNFKEVKFGRYWTTSFILDYELGLKFGKRYGFNLGFRYNIVAPVHNGNLAYLISQGTGITFKYGLFYQFK